MMWTTMAEMKTYFEEVEDLYQSGQLRPNSPEGEQVKGRLIVAMNEVTTEMHHILANRANDLNAILYLVDMRTKLALLLGKFEGFRYGQMITLGRMGRYSEYLT